ncbi:MAG: hypothetical protein KJP23_17705, partial [Deltaproteobacteria bacterium]|nr:hypothetical protein [Deltaproteobacteria bacterium]
MKNMRIICRVLLCISDSKVAISMDEIGERLNLTHDQVKKAVYKLRIQEKVLLEREDGRLQYFEFNEEYRPPK